MCTCRRRVPWTFQIPHGTQRLLMTLCWNVLVRGKECSLRKREEYFMKKSYFIFAHLLNLCIWFPFLNLIIDPLIFLYWWERRKREEYSLRRFFCFICIYTSSNFLSIFIFFAFIIFILFPVIYTLFLFLLFAFYYLYFPLFYIYLGTLNQLMALRLHTLFYSSDFYFFS